VISPEATYLVWLERIKMAVDKIVNKS